MERIWHSQAFPLLTQIVVAILVMFALLISTLH